MSDNPCFECRCGWYDSDMGCTCPPGEEWYQCPLEPEPDWDSIMKEGQYSFTFPIHLDPTKQAEMMEYFQKKQKG